MIGDRLTAAFRKTVHRVLSDDSEQAPINYGRLHAARVVAANEDGVAVIFDEERLGSKTGVPLSADPGLALQVRPGTRVLVGWADADETQPFVAAIWLGAGGLRSAVQAYEETYTFDGPLLRATGDVECVHDIAGGAAPTVLGLLPNVTGVVVAGGDRMMELEVTVVSSAVPNNTPFLQVTFGSSFSKPFALLVGAPDGKPPRYVKQASGFQLKTGADTLPIGVYNYTVKTGA